MLPCMKLSISKPVQKKGEKLEEKKEREQEENKGEREKQLRIR